LTEPKTSVVFARPPKPLGPRAFAARIARVGVALDRATQLLYDDAAFYINRDVVANSRAPRQTLCKLANERALRGRDCARLRPSLVALLHHWYRYGFLAPQSSLVRGARPGPRRAA